MVVHKARFFDPGTETVIIRKPSFFTYAVLGLVGANVAASIYNRGISQFFANLAEHTIFIGIFAGVAAYFCVARRFLDRGAIHAHWNPFTRDLVQLGCFILIVSGTMATLHISVFLLAHFLFPAISR